MPGNRSRAQIDKLALFADMGYRPHDGQLAVHLSRASRRVLACGVRWGKTRCATMEVVAALLQPNRKSALGWVVGPDHTVSDRIIKRVHQLLDMHCRHRILEVSMRSHTLRVRNLGGGASEVQGRSADNPASLLGEGLDWLVVDEAARLRDDLWDEHLSQRLVEKGGWALILSTPRGAGWFYEAYRRGREGDVGYEAWTGPTWDNPHIDRAVVEAERDRLSEDSFRQEYEGQFVGPGIPRCEVCGFPRQEMTDIPILENGHRFGRCGACDEVVLDDGRALAVEMEGKIVELTIELVDRARTKDPGLV